MRCCIYVVLGSVRSATSRCVHALGLSSTGPHTHTQSKSSSIRLLERQSLIASEQAPAIEAGPAASMSRPLASGTRIPSTQLDTTAAAASVESVRQRSSSAASRELLDSSIGERGELLQLP